MRCRVVGHQPQAALVNTRSLFMPSPVGLYCILPPADAVHGSVNHVVNSTISPMSRDSRSAGQNKNSSDDFIFSRNKSTNSNVWPIFTGSVPTECGRRTRRATPAASGRRVRRASSAVTPSSCVVCRRPCSPWAVAVS